MCDLRNSSESPVSGLYRYLAIGVAALSVPLAASGASGQFLDQDQKPVADAWVVASREECLGIAHCSTHCLEVHVARTDRRGRFSFASRFRPIRAYKLNAYREGHRLDYRQRGSRLEPALVRDAAVRTDSAWVQARLTDLVTTARQMSCSSAPIEERAALIPVYRDMFREARSISRFPEHQRLAKGICAEMYWTQLRGSDPTPSDEERERLQRQFLQGVEPACNVDAGGAKEQALLAAITAGDTTQIREAARQGFDFNRFLNGDSPPIVLAAIKGVAAVVVELAAAGAKPDLTGVDNRTALDHMLSGYYGSRESRIAVVRALLAAGADPNRPDVWGYPPLVRVASAADGTDREMFALLLSSGARVDQEVSCLTCSERGASVIHFVRDESIARQAIAQGANVNARIRGESTPLMRVQNPAVAKLLLTHGADPNAVGSTGWTALMNAIQSYESFRATQWADAYREIVELLVAAGARLDARNQHGLDAFYYTKDEALKTRLRALAVQ